MDPVEFHDYVIKPTLDQIGHDEPGASFLLLGTALVETDLRVLRQANNGPALGVYQMEPATHTDLWVNWLVRHKGLGQDILHLMSDWPNGATQMVANLQYATAMARCLYLREPEPLPAPFDLQAMALYWKGYWNTFQPEQTHEYVMSQLRRFTERFPQALIDRERG